MKKKITMNFIDTNLIPLQLTLHWCLYDSSLKIISYNLMDNHTF